MRYKIVYSVNKVKCSANIVGKNPQDAIRKLKVVEAPRKIDVMDISVNDYGKNV